ncbi:MAG: Flp pilus assembly complex ATPase component TadA [Myxococcales bacterium]|nr:Flp pilus assembly complex ATPase component TadA [Myxococcales bacterium]
MFAVIIHEKGGQPRRQEFAKSEVTIGRVQGNDIILPKQNVSKRHSRIVVKDGKFIIVDLKSTNGTYVNGRKIASPMVIKQSDKIYIGDFILSVEALDGAEAAAPEPMAPPEPPRPKAPPPPPRPKPATPAPVPAAPRPAPPRPVAPAAPPAPQRRPPARPPAPASSPCAAPQRPRRRPRAGAPCPWPARRPRARPRPPCPRAPAAFAGGAMDDSMAGQVHARLAAHFESNGGLPGSYAPGQGVDDMTWKRAEQAAREALQSLGGGDDEGLVAQVVAEALAVGPLTALLDDAGVQRVCVNGAQSVYVTRGGSTTAHDARFSSPAQAAAAACRLLAACGVAVPAGAPFAEGHLADGTRVHAAMGPVGGPFVTVDRPAAGARDLDALVAAEVLSANLATFLRQAVEIGRAVVIASNDLDARIELINALLHEGASDLRVVAVEGGARLGNGANMVTLSGAPGADNAALVQQALKMRPDRLVVVDARGPETFHAISALQGGVNGGVIGVDAESPDDAIARMVRHAGLAVHTASDRIEATVRDGVDVLVQLLRYADGRTNVTQVFDIDGDMHEVFSGFQATGHVPRWFSNAQSLGHAVDPAIFR